MARSSVKSVKIEVSSAGLVAILKSQRVGQDLEARAQRIQAAMPSAEGEEFTADAFQGADRANAVVRTANYAARKTAAERPEAILAALNAGR